MDNVKFTLQYCIDSARRGERQISVFDLMYEGIKYVDLQKVLATLAERGEIEITDIKNFNFIGNIRELDENRRAATVLEEAPFTEEIDSDYIRALEYVIQDNRASASFIQRRCGTGYIKACKIIDWMESQVYISPPNGPWARKVLITKEEFREKFNPFAFKDSYSDIFDDDDDGEEDPFEALERYQEERLNDAFMEYEKKLKEDPSLSEEFLQRDSDEEETPFDEIPKHPSWSNEFEFMRAVRKEKEQIIMSDKNMGVKGAISKVESLLTAARRIGNDKLAEVFERLILEFKNTTPYEYTKLKKKYFQ